MRSSLVAAVLAMSGVTAPGAPPARVSDVVLAVEGRTNANPSMAAEGAFVAIAWSASTTTIVDVYASTSRDGGVHWGAPVRVNATPGDARVSGEQPPRVALRARAGAAPEVIVVWTSRVSAGSRLLSARSTDGGRHFGNSVVVPGAEGAGNRGWESVAVDTRGRAHVLWLDHREAAMPAGMHHQDGAVPIPDPVEKAGRSQLYTSSLDGAGARSLARGVCYCCKTSLVAAGGALYATWRHVFAGNQRDIGFAVSRDDGRSWSAPVRVSEDHWAFDGCPENGPAVVVDAAARVHVLWPTPADGANGTPLSLFHAMSRDGVAFTARTPLPVRGPAAHVQGAATADGSVLAVWDEVAKGERRVAVARSTVDAGGRMRFTRVPVHGDAGGRWYPVVAASGETRVLAWVGATGIGISRLP